MFSIFVMTRPSHDFITSLISSKEKSHHSVFSSTSIIKTRTSGKTIVLSRFIKGVSHNISYLLNLNIVLVLMKNLICTHSTLFILFYTQAVKYNYVVEGQKTMDDVLQKPTILFKRYPTCTTKNPNLLSLI